MSRLSTIKSRWRASLKLSVLVIFAALTIIASGGGGNNDYYNNPPDTGSSDGLRLTLLDSSIRDPAIVSVSFKVTSESGQPVPRLTLANNFSLLENGTEISSFEATPRLTPEPNEFMYSTLLLLDLSGSILGSSFEALKIAAETFIDRVVASSSPNSWQIKIAFFDGNANITPVTEYLSDRLMLKNAINGLTPDMSTDSSTNLNGAVIQGVQDLDAMVSAYDNTGTLSAGSLVIFTDGQDQASRVSENDARRAVNDAPDDLTIFTIGLQGEIDADALEAFGRDGYVQAEAVDNLADSFNAIADRVNNEANSYYLLDYCSPKRSGRDNELTIVAEVDGLRGELKTKFSAETFGGGCVLTTP